MTNEEWAIIAARLPGPAGRGRPRQTPLREVVNAIFYIGHTCCQCRLLPKDFPHFTAVQYYFYHRRARALRASINHELSMLTREAEGHEASPSAGVIDSQSVKTTEAGGPSGYDADKRIKGRKRHLLTDCGGLPVGAVVHTADIQDRDGAPAVFEKVRYGLPWLRHVFADPANSGQKLEALASLSQWRLQIVCRGEFAKGFRLLPRRRVVERTIAWLNPNRRLATDFKVNIESAHAWIMIASIKLVSRRLARD